MAKSNTVLAQILDECRKAVIGKKPIICLRTDELEMVHRIIQSDELVVRMSKGAPSDMQEFIPTRLFQKDSVVQLFSKHSEKRINFNIFYIGNDARELKYSENEYGLPSVYLNTKITNLKMLGQFMFPSLYVFHANRSDQNNTIKNWDKLSTFIDQYIQEPDGSAIKNSVILIYGEDCDLPTGLLPYCQIVDIPYPRIEELKDYIDSKLTEKSFLDVGDEDRKELAESLLGLPLIEAERLIDQILAFPCEDEDITNLIYNTVKAKKVIQEQKKQILKKQNLLELVSRSEDSNLGGLEEFQRWIENQKDALQHADRLKHDTGVSAPKGVLLCGIPGCGKSMAVQMAAKELDLPLLKMDIGHLMGSYVGQSEHNMEKALKIAEAMSPCILFIDELDKGFSGAAGGRGDENAVFKRMFGTMLSWMQNCTEPCFIFATANSIAGLPKEFFRSGRFEMMYSLFMPTEEECRSILKKRMENAQSQSDHKMIFTQDALCDSAMKGYMKVFTEKKARFVTGADIDKLVKTALRNRWSESGVPRHIDFKEWEKMLSRALETATVYGDSVSNLDSIAVCTIQLLRNNFIPATDKTLFRVEDYSVSLDDPSDSRNKQTNQQSEELSPCVKIRNRSAELQSDYDRALYDAIYERMEKFSKQIEKNALVGLLR